MSAHADKTLHWKISGNINETDTFLHIFKNVIFRHEFVDEFSRISFTNLSTKFVRIRINFLHEKLVMLRTASTVVVLNKCIYK